MPREPRLYLLDMLDHSQKARRKTADLTSEQFLADDTLCLAVTHLVQIIGEAAARVPEQVRQSTPHIAWREIIGMRNLLVHDYGGVDYRIVWQVVQDDLPALIESLEKALNANDNPQS